ncbi:hypothetical protein E4U41_002397 [Claviceps citrina]|nr:hypothetical protein E4U41_002397 [Claviceps citrina]
MSNVNIATAFKKLPTSAQNRPLWYSYPQFACFTLREAAIDVSSSSKRPKSFIRELRKMLRLSDESGIVTSIRTDELGLDSLVAIIRIISWFLNKFHVNIPALRILIGASLRDLILQPLEAILAELVPNISPVQCQRVSIRIRRAREPGNTGSSPGDYTGSTTQNEDTSLLMESETEISVFEDSSLAASSPRSIPHHDTGIQRESHVAESHIGRHMSEGIRQLATNQRSTAFHTYLAAVSALLHRFLEMEDVCVGIVDSCWSEHISRNKTLAVLANALPFEVILNKLHVVREPTHAPPAQVLSNYSGSIKTELQYRDDNLGRWAASIVGRASPNKSLYILDPNLNPLAVGHVGAVCLGGVGVAEGFFNNAERTEVAFISNFFAT